MSEKVADPAAPSWFEEAWQWYLQRRRHEIERKNREWQEFRKSQSESAQQFRERGPREDTIPSRRGDAPPIGHDGLTQDFPQGEPSIFEGQAKRRRRQMLFESDQGDEGY